MAINYAKLRSLTARKIISALLAEGFVFDRQRGSHRQYKHPTDGRRVTVPIHPRMKTFIIQNLKSMIEGQAHWSEADLRRLKLLK